MVQGRRRIRKGAAPRKSKGLISSSSTLSEEYPWRRSLPRRVTESLTSRMTSEARSLASISSEIEVDCCSRSGEVRDEGSADSMERGRERGDETRRDQRERLGRERHRATGGRRSQREFVVLTTSPGWRLRFLWKHTKSSEAFLKPRY